jgi:hypothetical protein
MIQVSRICLASSSEREEVDIRVGVLGGMGGESETLPERFVAWSVDQNIGQEVHRKARGTAGGRREDWELPHDAPVQRSTPQTVDLFGSDVGLGGDTDRWGGAG